VISKRGAKYVVRIYDPTVKGRKRWVGTFDTLRESRAAEREAEKQTQAAVRFGKETCGSFAGRFLDDFCRGLEASTLKTYAYAISAFASQFEHARLLDIDRPTARAWANTQPRNTQNVIRTIFNHAMREGLVPSNPFANMGLKQSRGRKDITVLTVEQLHQLADTALEVHGADYGPTYRAMILFAAYTAMRPGELFALRWEDIDVQRSLIRVKHSLSTVNTIKAPKNGRARVIVLPDIAAEALTDVIRHAGVPYVFTSKTGRRFTRPTHSWTWGLVRASAGQPIKDFYELRHFCATYLLERGLPATDVAVQMGHTDNGKLVLDTYGHPNEDIARTRILGAFRQSHDVALAA
jgi:integrase